MAKCRCLIFIVAYHAETTIQTVVRRIPRGLLDDYDVEILIIDNSSTDRTFERSYALTQDRDIPFKINLLFNPVNQGYGDNQKLGYQFAMQHGYDFVALLHGDGQYAPECLPEMLRPLQLGAASAVFGSRMLTPRGALRGGMPLYKFIGNKILTWVQNRILCSNLSEFHSGYRIYTVDALRSIPFEYNSSGFEFDTEMIIQLMFAGFPIVELPVPTYYGREISNVNGIKYAANVLRATMQARLQALSLFYDCRFDCVAVPLSQYKPKLNFKSTHSFTLDAVRAGARVLDLGCASGYMCSTLALKKACRVTGVDTVMAVEPDILEAFYACDLNDGVANIPVETYDVVLLMDVIEHLAEPEVFLSGLRKKLSLNPEAELIISTGNVAFIVTRLMLMFGCFNYGKRGILDLTHTRLFTIASLKRLLNQTGFSILETKPLPAPFPLALGENRLSRFLLTVNSFLMRLSASLFGYQVIMRAKARPTVEWLLQDAHVESNTRQGNILAARAGGSSLVSRGASDPAYTPDR